MADVINIEILEDGTIKTSTDKISMPNHSNAENLLLTLARQTDGKVSRTTKHQHQHHTHDHHQGHSH